MPRYIDADKIEYVQSEDGVLNDYAFRYDINYIPTADVVEIVRCKDCKMHSKFNKKLGFSMCNKWGNITKENDFCSYGEQRERENGNEY